MVFSLALTGCVGVIVGGFIWEQRASTMALAWSDDGTRVAGADAQYEITANADPPFIPGRVRSERYRIFTRNLDGTDTQYLGPEREGRLEQAFYMKSAGYLLAKEHAADSSAVRFLKWPMTGGEPEIIWQLNRVDYDQFVRLLPSRDGRLLAQCRLSPERIREGKVTVLITLLDAATLKPVREAVVPMRCESESSLDVQWLADGRLRVTCYVQRDAAVVAADGSVMRVPVPREIGAATSSGALNAQGQYLYGFKPDGSVDAFGGGDGN